MFKRRLKPEEKSWQRLVRDLDKHAAKDWSVLGLLSDPEKYPGSLYKLYVHRGGRARWWKADFGIGQVRFHPIKYQDAIPKEWALPADRLVQGSAVLLRDMTCHPEKTGLVKMLGEIQKQLMSQN